MHRALRRLVGRGDLGTLARGSERARCRFAPFVTPGTAPIDGGGARRVPPRDDHPLSCPCPSGQGMHACPHGVVGGNVMATAPRGESASGARCLSAGATRVPLRGASTAPRPARGRAAGTRSSGTPADDRRPAGARTASVVAGGAISRGCGARMGTWTPGWPASARAPVADARVLVALELLGDAEGEAGEIDVGVTQQLRHCDSRLS